LANQDLKGVVRIQSSLSGSLISEPADLNSGNAKFFIPDYASQHRCAFASSTNLKDFNALVNGPLTLDRSSCWPFTQVAYSISPNIFFGSAVHLGNLSLALQEFIAIDSDFDTLAAERGLLAVSVVPLLQKAVLKALDNVLCDYNNCLVARPVVWTLAPAAASFVIAMTSIGCVIAAALMGFLFVNRQNAVIRASSVQFLASTLAGILLLLISSSQLVSQPTDGENIPTDEYCQSWSWFLFLGFSITFLPLGMKTWRISMIFGGKKLKVTKISNRRLATMTGLVLALEFTVGHLARSQWRNDPD
jgi:hypothetical protein